MIKKIFSKALFIVVSFSVTAMMAQQHFQTMPVQSGYTADVIANGVGPSALSTTHSFDGTYYNLVATDFKLAPTNTALTYGLPANGVINSEITSGLNFQLGDLNGNNSLRLGSNIIGSTDNTGTMLFSNPVAAVKLYMLAASGQGTANVSVTVNFTDNTTQLFTQEIPFWNSTRSNYAIRGVGRINRNTDVLQPYPQDPKLYQTVHNIDAANQTKLIQSITVKKITSEGVANIFAFSVDAYTDCVEPVLQPTGIVTSNSAQISWTVPTGTQAVSHDIYYSTSPMAPTSSTIPNYSGVTGTSYTLGNLSATTKYYYWVRTHCNGMMSQSQWSLSKNFTTLCGAIIPPYTNDFNITGNPAFPGVCWAIILGGTPATGPTETFGSGWDQHSFLNTSNGNANLAARTSIAAANDIYWLRTPLFDLSAGGYKVKFNYGLTQFITTSSAQLGADDVIHFMISNDGGITWLILKTWDVNDNPSNISNEYTYDLTANTSAVTRFAFYVSSGTVQNSYCSFFVDDFKIENNIQLSTSEVKGNVKKASVHPNPFKDILYISDTREVKSVTVGDASGRTMKTFTGSVKELDLSTLNTGLYFVTIYFKDGSQSTVKAVKK
ncbi:putative secreted protein (Por secretion system target) [Chryseobacterium sp. 52]|uniref:T9SS type A sorting domain-containing protein n=1 Tax=Chryseobacterium sp. 52 TaxID=2035213 RepID=UPI000C1877BD|nr:T9SS type A sorting domain-containing protein [Chryseobacterium sp. 52]PIF47293.1 putative secreted protein (Por secretion system target) [Chryseobacterium sp. 52]